jgi:mRNA interferase RelE/StbE
MYDVIYSDDARKQLKKLHKELRNRIILTLKRIRIRPHHHVKKLMGNPYFSLRVGEYRVILDIQDGKLLIFVIEMRYRRKIYT